MLSTRKMSGVLAPISLQTPQVQNGSTLSLAREAAQLRRIIVEVLFQANGGHYGGCLSVIDILLTLYRRILRVCPEYPRHPERDRLILSKGHAAVSLYAVLQQLGFFETPLEQYADFGSPLEGHPDMTTVPGVDFSTGSLGQGLSVGVGMALALRTAQQHVWVVLGDGECQEGQVWEAAMLGAFCGLDNLHAIIDFNRFQEWGRAATPECPHPVPVPDMAQKWAAFGWQVFECDGHDFVDLENTMAQVNQVRTKPSVIIAHTIKGKGVSLAEEEPRQFHCTAVSQSEHNSIIRDLNGN